MPAQQKDPYVIGGACSHCAGCGEPDKVVVIAPTPESKVEYTLPAPPAPPPFTITLPAQDGGLP